MRKSLLMVALSTLMLSNILASEVLRGRKASEVIPGTEVVRFKDFTSIPNYIKFYPEHRIPFTSWQNWMLSQFFKSQPNTSFELIGTEQDKLGMTHYRFQQSHNHIPVTFGIWIVHVSNGQVVSMNGELFEEFPSSGTAIPESTALEHALQHINAEVYKWELDEEESLLQHEEHDHEASYYPEGELVYALDNVSMENTDFHLAWKFNIYAQQPLSRREIYIDATNGDVVFENNLIHHADSNGVAHTGYSGVQDIVADYTGSQFRLREDGRGNGVETYDMNNGTSYGASSDFFDNDNLWNTTSVSQYATDAHWGAEMTYDFYWNHFNRNSINNNGFTLRSYVHYDNNYANAFWDGQRMTYGDGNNGNAPFTALDIAGHEVTHGLTNFTANLVYQNEPGALNESFSDIFGAAIEFDALGQSNGDWTMGEDLGFVIRYMNNPNLAGDPDTYNGQQWYTGTGDNGGVHINSGVQNFWYYLLVTGGSGVNDLGNNYNVTSIGLTDANAIAYRNLVTYLTVTSQYEDARFYAIESALDLFGPCSQQVISTGNAWYAVGLGVPYQSTVTADFDADLTQSCQAPFTVSFSNFSSNATSYNWNFGDGNTSTQPTPTHTYTTSGNFTVTLNVSSTCGSDSLIMVDMVQIGPNIPCVTIMPENGVAPKQIECSGVLYDHGGPSGNYGDNLDSEITIAPAGAADVTINFDDFDLEAGGTGCIYDYLDVYDGSNTNAALIGRYCNSNMPPSSITSSNDALTLVFHSDGAVTEDGFKISWSCAAPTEEPSVDFTVNVNENCSGKFEFTDITSNGPTAWLWEFGDGDTSHQENPTHEYALSGTYSVKLTATNIIGTSSATKSSFVTVSKPEAPLGENVEICPGDVAELVATANSEVFWFDAPLNGNLVHTGDTFVTGVINNSTPYYAEILELGNPEFMGPADNTIGTGNNFNSFQYQIFDVHQKMILKSVKVFAGGAGVREIELRDANGVPLELLSVNMANGEQTIDLNFEIDPGTDYQLGISSNSQANMFRNNGGVNYPYELEGVCSITRSSANSDPFGFYYFFYNWEVMGYCASERAEIIASTGICTGIEEQNASSFSVYPNPSQGTFTIEVSKSDAPSTFTITDLTGKVIQQFSGNSTNMEVDTDLPSGVYLIRREHNTLVSIKRLVVQ